MDSSNEYSLPKSNSSFLGPQIKDQFKNKNNTVNNELTSLLTNCDLHENININYDKKKDLLLYLTIELDKDKQQIVSIYKEDKPEDVAIRFIINNNLDISLKEDLTQIISDKIIICQNKLCQSNVASYSSKSAEISDEFPLDKSSKNLIRNSGRIDLLPWKEKTEESANETDNFPSLGNKFSGVRNHNVRLIRKSQKIMQ